MHKLVVLYPEPADPAAFRSYYESTHLPLAATLPGLLAARYSTDLGAAGPESAPFFAVFEAEFESADAMGAALGSPEGQAVAADVPNYATGGAHIVHFSPVEVRADPCEVMLRYLDGWARRDVDAIVGMFAEEGTYSDPSLAGATLRPGELAKHLAGLFAAVPDLTLRVVAAAADGPDTAVAYWRGSGTATGPGSQSNGGTLDFPGGDVLRIDAEGRIVWTEALYDQKTFAEQAGFA